MSYRPHRSHVRYAAVAGPACPPRRRTLRAVTGETFRDERAIDGPCGVIVGIANALPLSLLLWSCIAIGAHAIF